MALLGLQKTTTNKQKTAGLEPVPLCEPSTYQPSNRWHSHCAMQGVVPQSDLSSTIIVSRCYNDLSSTIIVSRCYNDLSSTIIVRRCYNDLSSTIIISRCYNDLSSTIIVSRCYNDLNYFLQLTVCSTKIP